MRSTALLLIVFFSVLTFAPGAQPQSFNCSSPAASCGALIDYVPTNATTLAQIKTLFGVKNHRTLLGANSMSLSTSPNQTVDPKMTIRIPFRCICVNGTGISNKRPVYKVQPGDGLDHIARELFSALVTFQQIAVVNNISNPNLIKVGQELWIPLPCSCDAVDGAQVVHYGHVVASGSSVEQIAEEYGTTSATLMRLNGITDPNDLQAGTVLDVPLRACTSMVRNDSLDYPLLVSNGTYTFTANNCIQCKCDSSNNWTLQCDPSQGIQPATWSQCPSMQCEGGLNLGSTTSCPSCAYAGYSNQTVFTTLANNCSTEAPLGNYAQKISMRGPNWRFLLISLDLGLLCFGLLW